jgi:hypothetical protein
VRRLYPCYTPGALPPPFHQQASSLRIREIQPDANRFVGRPRLRFLACSNTILWMAIPNHAVLLCDGCGQWALPEHTTRRLQRLEWMTRFRPVHIGTVLLGAASPERDSDFLYAETAEITGEAAAVLAASGISPAGKSKEALLAEFQRGGFLLGYVLECPLEAEAREGVARDALLKSRLPLFLARLRRSFRPKRVASISSKLDPLFAGLTEAELGCALLGAGGKSFALDGPSAEREMERLYEVLSANKAVGR